MFLRPAGVLLAVALVQGACDRRLDVGENLRDAAVPGDAGLPAGGTFTVNGVATGALLNGDAYAEGRVVVLTDAIKWQRGTAMFPQPFVFEPGGTMTVHFVFRVGPGDDPADGIALVWHAHPSGARGLGNNGANLAVDGLAPGIIVAFDTHDQTSFEQSPRIAIARSDLLSSGAIAMRSPPFAMTSGTPVHSWIEVGAGEIVVFVAESEQRPSEPWLRASLDLRAELGDTVTFGVGAGTGDKVSRHVVDRLDVTTTR